MFESREKSLPVDLGQRLLHFGARNGYVKLIETLLEADVDIDSQDEFGNTALYHAAWKSTKCAAATLIGHGANVDRKNSFGLTPLHLTAVYFIISSVSDDNLDRYGTNASGFRISVGHLEVAMLLLSTNADVTLRDMYGRRALDFLIRELE